MVFSRWLILILLVFSGLSSLGAEQYLGQPYLKIWRMLDRPGFTHARVVGYMPNEQNQMEIERQGTIRTASKAKIQSCFDLLDYSQLFSLSVMEDRGSAPSHWLSLLPQVAEKVHPSQLTVSEVSELVPYDEAQQLLVPNLQQGRTLTRVVGANSFHYAEQKQAALWMISGQTAGLTGAVQSPSPLPLYWQQHDNFSQMKQANVDREEHKYIWELGRAARKGKDVFGYNMSAMVLKAFIERMHLSEIFGMGKGSVFIQLQNVEGVGRTRSVEGYMEYTEADNGSGAVIMVSDLDALMEKYDPLSQSAEIAKIIEISENTLSKQQALELLVTHKTHFKDSLDFHWPGETHAHQLLFERLSPAGYSNSLRQQLRSFGLKLPEITKLISYLSEKLRMESVGDTELSDSREITNGWARLVKTNAIHISNLIEDLVEDPEYLPSVIRHAADFYLRKLIADSIPGPGAIAENVCLRTGSSKVSSALAKMGIPMDTSSQYKDIGVSIHCLSLTDARTLEAKPETQLEKGAWSVRRRLEQPIIF